MAAKLVGRLRGLWRNHSYTAADPSGDISSDSIRRRPKTSNNNNHRPKTTLPSIAKEQLHENELPLTKPESKVPADCPHIFPHIPGNDSFKYLNTVGLTASRNNSSASTYIAVELPTPASEDKRLEGAGEDEHQDTAEHLRTSTPGALHLPAELQRGQSLISNEEGKLFRALLQTELPIQSTAAHFEHPSITESTESPPKMVDRKIWVKRPGASATLVPIHQDDLVDDVRDMILRKYANSLGRSFDAPDVTLRVAPREHRQERTLGPEEQMTRMLDDYFPGGQAVDEALIIDVPLRRTPKPSPQPVTTRAYYDDGRPAEAGNDYFPPMPVTGLPLQSPSVSVIHHNPPHPHAMSVITTGHVPTLPSPGGRTRPHRERPRIGRTQTTSPQVATAPSTGACNGAQALNYGPRVVSRSRAHSNASDKSSAPPVAPQLPTPPAQQSDLIAQRVATPPARASSPRPAIRPKKTRKTNPTDHPSLPAGILNSAVPPINVLIVEDNIINLKLLEAFMKRLKVRWQTAMNGREAVNKWRGGGFHLVLMDIQLPIMSGLEATKEIRRLERLNSIGVFSSSASSSAPERQEEDEPEDEDVLPIEAMFKSPVIIVALTASSLQSDRHEALAAGCNDFLTKPVNFVWLERKVMEWGCMQALIDFDGWRKWKDFSNSSTQAAGSNPTSTDPASTTQPSTPGKSADAAKNAEQKRKKKHRSSLGAGVGMGPKMSIKEEMEEIVGGITVGEEVAVII